MLTLPPLGAGLFKLRKPEPAAAETAAGVDKNP
jgi:hypothetical protein